MKKLFYTKAEVNEMEFQAYRMRSEAEIERKKALSATEIRYNESKFELSVEWKKAITEKENIIKELRIQIDQFNKDRAFAVEISLAELRKDIGKELMDAREELAKEKASFQEMKISSMNTSVALNETITRLRIENETLINTLSEIAKKGAQVVEPKILNMASPEVKFIQAPSHTSINKV